jgi:4-alpha-glucanotransferase
VQESYLDVAGKRRHAPAEVLLAMLEALGAPVCFADGTGVPEALALRRRQIAERVVEPVVLAWDGQLASVVLHVPDHAAGPLSWTLLREDGVRQTGFLDLAASGVARDEIDGRAFSSRDLPLRWRLPLGYHRLSIEGCGEPATTLVIAAPRHAYPGPPGSRWDNAAQHPSGGQARLWGLFAPLYALASEAGRDPGGIGNFTDLGTLLRWVGDLGGSIVATLPLLPTFLREFFEPSPYSPVSRLFWNEVFIDVAAVPEVAASPAAQAAIDTSRRLVEPPGGRPRLVDWQAVAAAKRRVLEAAAESLFDGPATPRREQLESFAQANPRLDDYASFRAACEQFQSPWQAWPEAARDGRLDGRDAPHAARRYHRYAQWIAAGQIEAAAGRERAGLLFDLPLGVHPAGYDVWRERDIFVRGASTGAPPDALNPLGQDWGNPPLHPQRIRESGYGYQIASVRHLLAHSGVLRVDHVMGLHRTFVLPKAAGGGHGVYLRHHADEGYAILALESYRARGGTGAMIVGEDLGTVPGYVRHEMASRGVHRCYVAQFGIAGNSDGAAPADPGDALVPVPADAFASLNTHDTPPFAAFWRGTDIDQRLELGLLTEEQAGGQHRRRGEERHLVMAALQAKGLLAAAHGQALDDKAPVEGGEVEQEEAVLEAWLGWLAASPARAVIVSLEDLWGETGPQNVPGTVNEYPNWRRCAPWCLEEICSLPLVVGRLKTVDGQRRATSPETGS